MTVPPLPPSYPGSMPPYGYQPYEEPPRVSGVAVSALIVSLILCIPFLSSLVAIVLGIAGLIITANPKKKGRFLALAGLLIGLLGLIGWSVASYVGYKQFGEPLLVGVNFQENLRQGNLEEAEKLTAPPFDAAKLPELSARLKVLGPFQSMTAPRGRPTTNPVVTSSQFSMRMNMIFANGSEQVDFGMTKTDAGWRITRYDIIPFAATRASQSSTNPSLPDGGMVPDAPAAPTPPPAP